MKQYFNYHTHEINQITHMREQKSSHNHSKSHSVHNLTNTARQSLHVVSCLGPYRHKHTLESKSRAQQRLCACADLQRVLREHKVRVAANRGAQQTRELYDPEVCNPPGSLLRLYCSHFSFRRGWILYLLAKRPG